VHRIAQERRSLIVTIRLQLAILESPCISSHQGYVLGRGSYVYYQALQDRKPVPSLDTLLGDPDRIDLADRFRRSTQTIS
jgi:hypothetical protein